MKYRNNLNVWSCAVLTIFLPETESLGESDWPIVFNHDDVRQHWNELRFSLSEQKIKQNIAG